MYGAVIGDILGSTYEGSNTGKRDDPLCPTGSRFTDDTVCTIAVADSVMNGIDPAVALRNWGRVYPHAGYGGTFFRWLFSDAGPYGSFANGSLMRVSPAVYLSTSIEQAQKRAAEVTAVTHNHEVAMQAVHAYTDALWQAMQGKNRDDVCAIILGHGYQPHDIGKHRDMALFSLRADETLQDVLSCLMVATDFESLMRECIFHGGDVDTICAIAGPIGEALWGIPEAIRTITLDKLPEKMRTVLEMQYRAH